MATAAACRSEGVRGAGGKSNRDPVTEEQFAHEVIQLSLMDTLHVAAHASALQQVCINLAHWTNSQTWR